MRVVPTVSPWTHARFDQELRSFRDVIRVHVKRGGEAPPPAAIIFATVNPETAERQACRVLLQAEPANGEEVAMFTALLREIARDLDAVGILFAADCRLRDLPTAAAELSQLFPDGPATDAEVRDWIVRNQRRVRERFPATEVILVTAEFQRSQQLFYNRYTRDRRGRVVLGKWEDESDSAFSGRFARFLAGTEQN